MTPDEQIAAQEKTILQLQVRIAHAEKELLKRANAIKWRDKLIEQYRSAETSERDRVFRDFTR